MNHTILPKKYLSKLYETCQSKMTNEEFQNSFTENGLIIFFPHFASFLLKELPLFNEQEMIDFVLGFIEHDINHQSILCNSVFFNTIKNHVAPTSIDFHSILLNDKNYGPQYFINSINHYDNNHQSSKEIHYTGREIKLFLENNSNNKGHISFNLETFTFMKSYINKMNEELNKNFKIFNLDHPLQKILNISVGGNEITEDFEHKVQLFCDTLMKSYFDFSLNNENVHNFVKNDLILSSLKNNNLTLNLQTLIDNDEEFKMLYFPHLYISYAKYAGKLTEFVSSLGFQDFLKSKFQDSTPFSCSIPTYNLCMKDKDDLYKLEVTNIICIYANLYQRLLPILEEIRASDTHENLQNDIQYILENHNFLLNKPVEIRIFNGKNFRHLEETQNIHMSTPHKEIEFQSLPDFLLNFASTERNKSHDISPVFRVLKNIVANNVVAEGFFNQSDISKNALLNFINQIANETYFNLEVDYLEEKNNSFNNLNNQLIFLNKEDLNGLRKIFEYFEYTFDEKKEVSAELNNGNLLLSKNYTTLYHIAELLKDYCIFNNQNPVAMKKTIIEMTHLELEKEIPLVKISTRVNKF